MLHIHKPKLSHEQKGVQWFLSVDPLAEKYLSWSPYNFVMNNPINLIDPDGFTTPLIEATITYFIHNAKDYDAYWYHSDHLGSSSYITNLNGVVTQHMEYLPFGELLVDEHQNSYNTPYKFNGKELDDETGNYYYGARYYNPKWSVWLSVDPLVETTMQPYRAFNNNPIRFNDLTGMIGEDTVELGWPPKWWNELTSWFNGSDDYKGSGWGHGLRTQILETLGFDNKADNLFEVGVMSMLQAGEVTMEGQALDKIASDPAIASYESDLMDAAKADPKFGKEAFSFLRKRNIQFEGKRAEGDMLEQAKDPFNPKYKNTWKVAANELTWLVRSTKVKSVISVNAEGKMTVTHKFSDVFDLRPSGGRSRAYNTATKVLGFLYHDLAGGNDQMRVKAEWNQTYQLKK